MSKLNINRKVYALAALSSMVLFTGCSDLANVENENSVESSIELEEASVNTETPNEVNESFETHYHVHIYDGDNILVFRECDGYTIHYDYNTGSNSMYQSLSVYDKDTSNLIYEYRGVTENASKNLIADEDVEEFFNEIEQGENYKIYKKSR